MPQNTVVLHPIPHIDRIIKRAIQIFKNNVYRKKINTAYTKLLQGSRYKKVLGPQKIAALEANKLNPICELSRDNIQALVRELGGTHFKYPNLQGVFVGDEEILFNTLINLPWQCQHATDYPTEILTSGQIMSYDGLRQLSSKYQSLFTTKRNVKSLGNTDFVFFRVFVEGENGDDTRYGHAKFITALDLLFENGWISLHDQESPFGKKACSRIDSKKNIRKGASSADKTILTYQYYDQEGEIHGSHQFSFLKEVFYGPDIFNGIALSFILELRRIKQHNPEFVEQFYQDFHTVHNDNEETEFLGKWVREFFRIEGKLPAKIYVQHDLEEDELLCGNPLAHPLEYIPVSLTKDPAELAEEEWQTLRNFTVIYKKFCRNPNNTVDTFQQYYKALVELIPLHVKKREPGQVLNYVKKYLKSVPRSPNIKCSNGEVLEKGLTILLMNNLISLKVPLQTRPTKDQQPPEFILKLELLLSSDYYDWLLNRTLEYSEIEDTSREILQTILDLYLKKIADGYFTINQLVTLSHQQLIAIHDYNCQAIMEDLYPDHSLSEFADVIIENPSYTDDKFDIIINAFVGDIYEGEVELEGLMELTCEQLNALIGSDYTFFINADFLEISLDEFADAELKNEDFVDELASNFDYLEPLKLNFKELYELYEENNETIYYLADNNIKGLISHLGPDFPPKISAYMRDKNIPFERIYDELCIEEEEEQDSSEHPIVENDDADVNNAYETSEETETDSEENSDEDDEDQISSSLDENSEDESSSGSISYTSASTDFFNPKKRRQREERDDQQQDHCSKLSKTELLPAREFVP